MTYKKKEVKRAIEELINDMQNIVDSSHNEYQERVVQFLNRINNSEILSKLINPYFDVEIPAGCGFYNSKVGHRIEYKLPLDDDVEIGAVLCFYRDNVVTPNHINNIVHWMYFGSSFDSNFAKFNAYIIVPAFKKLKRKLQYKLEDLEEIKNEDIEEKAIKIITLKNVNATNIAIGDNNIQNIIDNDVETIIAELNNITEINNEYKKELINLINTIKTSEVNKKSIIEKMIDLVKKCTEGYQVLKPIIVKVFTMLLTTK